MSTESTEVALAIWQCGTNRWAFIDDESGYTGVVVDQGSDDAERFERHSGLTVNLLAAWLDYLEMAESEGNDLSPERIHEIMGDFGAYVRMVEFGT